MNPSERDILESLDRAVRAAARDIEPIVARVASALRASPAEVLAWEPIPLSRYQSPLPDTIRSSWVFVLRANDPYGREYTWRARNVIISTGFMTAPAPSAYPARNCRSASPTLPP